jgi:signal transduction histidine kinase/CheY-like chemotaxis protein
MHPFFKSFLLAFSEASEADKRKLIRLVLCLSALINVALSASSGGHQDLYATYMGGLAAFMALWVLSYLNVSNTWLVNGLMVVSLLSGLNICLITGGIHSPTLMWLVFLPNLALFFISQRATLLWMLVVISVLTLVGYLSLENHDHWQEAHISFPGNWTAFNLVLVQLFFMMVHLIYDARYREKSNRISQSMKRMKLMKKHLQLTESYKDRFISTVSEELRSPMNAILGYSEVLVEMAKEKPGLVDTSMHIRSSILHLLEMTNNILDHAQLNEAKLKLHDRPVPIQKLIRQEWPALQIKDRVEFKLEIQETMPEWLWCDPDRLAQIVHILVSNAKKFTLTGHVLLRWSYQSQILKIDVVDTGIGISDDVKSHIFKRFDKADEKINREFGGIGLGLANALELTKLFGGTMGFKSETKKGSHFWVRLPMKVYNINQHPVAPEDERVQLAHARILVVDDHAVSMMVTMQMLRHAWPQAQLMHASSGAKAMDIIRTQQVDLVLMDVLMPHMDGPSTCRMIRQDLGLDQSQLVVVGLTASTHVKDKERCFEAGMNDVVIKPIEASQFINILTKQINQSRGNKPESHALRQVQA